MADPKDLDVSVMPQYLSSDGKSLAGSARVTGRKALDDDSAVEAYADVAGMRNKDMGTKFSIPSFGAKYRKQLGPDSSVEFYGEKRPIDTRAGIRYQKTFKKGGAVSSASKRADGCAQRGKTRGKII